MRIRRFLAGLPALFLGAVLVQSVFATTYVINDGGRTFSCTLYTASTREALSAAGVELTEADVYTREADTIYVRRAPTVTLIYHGKSSTVVSEEETVRQLLDRLGIQLAQDDVLSLPAYTVLQRGMELRIDRVESREEVFTREIPRQTRILWAPELPQGVEEVLNPGQDGALECRAWVTYVNGQETQREILEQRQTVPAVDCLIARGSGPAVEKTQQTLQIGDGIIGLRPDLAPGLHVLEPSVDGRPAPAATSRGSSPPPRRPRPHRPRLRMRSNKPVHEPLVEPDRLVRSVE